MPHDKEVAAPKSTKTPPWQVYLESRDDPSGALRELSLDEMTQVAGGPEIENNNQR